MKRSLHLGLTLLCLLAIILTPVLCGHAFPAGQTTCRTGMAASMPMPQQHTAPPCCSTHSTQHPAQAAIALDDSATFSEIIGVPLPFVVAHELSRTPHLSRPSSPPPAFRPPLRI